MPQVVPEGEFHRGYSFPRMLQQYPMGPMKK